MLLYISIGMLTNGAAVVHFGERDVCSRNRITQLTCKFSISKVEPVFCDVVTVKLSHIRRRSDVHKRGQD